MVMEMTKRKVCNHFDWLPNTMVWSLMGRVWAQCACVKWPLVTSSGYFEIDCWFRWGVDRSMYTWPYWSLWPQNWGLYTNAEKYWDWIKHGISNRLCRRVLKEIWHWAYFWKIYTSLNEQLLTSMAAKVSYLLIFYNRRVLSESERSKLRCL